MVAQRVTLRRTHVARPSVITTDGRVGAPTAHHHGTPSRAKVYQSGMEWWPESATCPVSTHSRKSAKKSIISPVAQSVTFAGKTTKVILVPIVTNPTKGILP